MRPDRGRPLRRPAALAAVVFGLLLVAPACSGTDHKAEVIEYVVPKGAAVRIARGEKVEVMPARVWLRLGDTLRIRNDDVIDQAVGGYLVKAGRSLDLKYGAPGSYELECAVSEGGSFTIVVEP